jgi:hypothetical protein
MSTFLANLICTVAPVAGLIAAVVVGGGVVGLIAFAAVGGLTLAVGINNCDRLED